jgi:hypothetical protein
MTAHTNIAEIAALIGDPGRANMSEAKQSGAEASELRWVATAAKPPRDDGTS